MNKKSNCIMCGSKLEGRQTMYCSSKCKNSNHQSYPSQKKRGLKRKNLLVAEFGGGCSMCGYKRNLSALTFHHTRDKLFKLDARCLSNRTMSSIKKEAKKCKLLCHNCHSELHNPSLNLVS